jgi:predicted enzyme related to lactoylglutathione lyase
MATPLDFMVFYVSDLDESLSYFTAKLGFTYDPTQDTPIFRQLSDGGSGVGIGLVQAGEQTGAPGTIALYFKTADIGSLRAAITGKGVEATPIVQRPFGSIFTVSSPDGHLLTMLQPPAGG